MRVEVGVAGAGVEVIERGSDEPGDIDLRNRAVPGGCTRARGRNFTLHERNHLRNRAMMRVRDERLDPGIGDRPQHRCGLRDREGEVEPRHRTSCAPGRLLGNDLRDGLALGSRRHRRLEVGDPRFDPRFLALVGREGATERLVGDRITASPHQELELVFRYSVAHLNLALSEGRYARAEPAARRRAFFHVVASERRREGPIPVGRRDRLEQVPVAVTR